MAENPDYREPLQRLNELKMRVLARHGGVALVLCCLSGAMWAQQNGHQLSAAERQHILDGQFKLISTIESIPTNIKEAFTQLSRQPSFAMANPGQKYQVGDFVVDQSLPFRRLVFAGSREDKLFIHYEKGGRGHGYYVVLFRVDPHGGVRFVWGGSGADGAKNLEQLQKMVSAGQFSDKDNYYW